MAFKVKKSNLFTIFAVFSFSFCLFFSCQSGYSFRVPGESEIITKNIASEYFSIAEEYFKLKNYQKAIQYYKMAMKDRSLNVSAYYKLARSYALSKDYETAEECFVNLLEKDPQNRDLQVSLAYVKAMKGNTAESLVLYRD